jgi:F-type H+-transporting ATPase subunit b
MLNANWGLFVWTLVTFGVALFILRKWVFIPLQRVIDERRQRVQETIDTAEDAREEAHRLLDEYKETLASVRSEADEILERSRRAGDEAKAEIVGEARVQADRAVARAHEQIERDTASAVAQLRAEVADLTMLATEKVVGRSLDDKDHARLVDEALKEIELADLKLGEKS